MSEYSFIDDSIKKQLLKKVSNFSSKSLQAQDKIQSQNYSHDKSQLLIQDYFSEKLRQYQLNMNDLSMNQEKLPSDSYSEEKIIQINFQIRVNALNLQNQQIQQCKVNAKRGRKAKKAQNFIEQSYEKKSQNDKQINDKMYFQDSKNSQKSKKQSQKNKDLQMENIIKNVQQFQLDSGDFQYKQQYEKRINSKNKKSSKSKSKNKRQKVKDKKSSKKQKNNNSQINVNRLDVSQFTIQLTEFQLQPAHRQIAQKIDKEILKKIQQLIKQNAQKEVLPEQFIRKIYKQYGEKNIILKSIQEMVNEDDEKKSNKKNDQEKILQMGLNISQKQSKKSFSAKFNELQQNIIKEIKKNPNIEMNQLLAKFPNAKKEKSMKKLLNKLMNKLGQKSQKFKSQKNKIKDIEPVKRLLRSRSQPSQQVRSKNKK